ncbi:hypothetical protein ACNOYE_00745 [Nannocystaceae bacterium ST9]
MRRSIVLGVVASVGLGFGLAGGCGTDFEEGTYRCSPRQAERCPEGYVCCSDDPAAIDLADLDADVLPKYQGREGKGVPIFSAGNDSLGVSGLCIAEGSVPPQAALTDAGAQACPIPCNPNWADADVTAVCGDDTMCCQTLELEPEDCVLDPSLGDAGCFRPVGGEDIEGLGGLDATRWASSEHATHQDPGGRGCARFVAGVPPEVLYAEGLDADELERACLRRLGVADSRGFCLGKSPAASTCPLEDPSYRDACEQLDDELGHTGCG